MATLIRMPEVAANTDSAVIVSWTRQEGDAVAQGDTLAEIETEKAVIEFNADQTGVLGKILVPAGTEAEVGAPIAVLLAAGEKNVDVAALLSQDGGGAAADTSGTDIAGAGQQARSAPAPVTASTSGSSAVSAPTSAASPAASSAHASAAAAPAPGGRIFASPLARRLARDGGIDLATLRGSGPQGRIIKRDVLAATSAGHAAASGVPGAASASAAVMPANAASSSGAASPTRQPGLPAVAAAGEAFTDTPHSSMRRTIARRLSESKQTVPHFYLRADCRMDALLALRAQINQTLSRKVSVNDIVMKAVAAAVRDLPEMNVSWTDTALRQYRDIDISVAVSTPGGLITPVVKAVDAKSLSQVNAEIADLAQRARDGKLAPHEYQGGSFTVSNLGMYGVQEFAAIINPPQAAILAVGGFEQRPAVVDGALGIASMMTVTLSVDHRAIDGALAARWLGIFKSIIENPLAALV